MEKTDTPLQKLFGVINKIGTAIMLNVLFLICCIPVVTIGPASSGLYSAARYLIRGDSPFSGFWAGFKTHFIRTMLATVICILVSVRALNSCSVYIIGMISDTSLISPGAILTAVIHGIFFLGAALTGTALIPVNVYFESDTSGWLRDAFYLVRKAPVHILITAAVMWFPVVLVLWFPVYGFFALLIFVAVYYMMAAVLVTAMLKKPLIGMLQRKQTEDSP